jgi:hypothetical protein
MSLFSRKKAQPFRVADLPVLDLAVGPIAVEIHHLAEKEHAEAFCMVFGKLLKDNAALFERAVITAVDTKYPIQDCPRSLITPAPISLLLNDPNQAAKSLYYSDNDEVVLGLENNKDSSSLLIRFDDPYFVWKSKN